jgi:imidazolonepropionase-like amidohydrolase
VRARPALLVGLALLPAGIAPRPGAPEHPSAIIVGATLIDGTGRGPIAGSFLAFQDGKITDVSTMAKRRGMMSLSRTVRVIDGGGRWILPGLVDAEARLADPSAARATVRWGVTTVRIAGKASSPERKRLESLGRLSSAPTLLFDGAGPLRRVPTDPLDDGAIEEWKSSGAFGEPELARADYLADPRKFLDRAFADARIAGSYSRPAGSKRPAEGAAMTSEQIATLLANVKNLARAGVPLALATNLPVLPGAAAHLELAGLVRAGVRPLDAIHDATQVSATALGRLDRGVLKEGQSADFILLDADPLADIRNTRSIVAVYEAGRMVWSRRP